MRRYDYPRPRRVEHEDGPFDPRTLSSKPAGTPFCQSYDCDGNGPHFPDDCKPLPVLCQWFAGCDRHADGVVAHPIIGDVPTCKRCADLLSLTLLDEYDNPIP